MGAFGSLLPVKYPRLLAGSLQVPLGFQCQAAIDNSVFWR